MFIYNSSSLPKLFLLHFERDIKTRLLMHVRISIAYFTRAQKLLCALKAIQTYYNIFTASVIISDVTSELKVQGSLVR